MPTSAVSPLSPGTPRPTGDAVEGGGSFIRTCCRIVWLIGMLPPWLCNRSSRKPLRWTHQHLRENASSSEVDGSPRLEASAGPRRYRPSPAAPPPAQSPPRARRALGAEGVTSSGRCGPCRSRCPGISATPSAQLARRQVGRKSAPSIACPISSGESGLNTFAAPAILPTPAAAPTGPPRRGGAPLSRVPGLSMTRKCLTLLGIQL